VNIKIMLMMACGIQRGREDTIAVRQNKGRLMLR
jgi:hypothetical protein